MCVGAGYWRGAMLGATCGARYLAVGILALKGARLCAGTVLYGLRAAGAVLAAAGGLGEYFSTGYFVGARLCAATVL